MPANKITGPFKDQTREINFRQAYGVNVDIFTRNVNDENWDWVECQLTFKKKGREAVLREVFKGGEDNSTDTVFLTYGDVEKEFGRFVDAELELVSYLEKL